jgi:hypothetical protein
MLEALLMHIYAVLNQTKTEHVVDTEVLKSKLGALQSAVDMLDAGAMHKIVESLLEVTQAQDMNAVIRKISNHILMGEYDEAVALVHALLHDDA